MFYDKISHSIDIIFCQPIIVFIKEREISKTNCYLRISIKQDHSLLCFQFFVSEISSLIIVQH